MLKLHTKNSKSNNSFFGISRTLLIAYSLAYLLSFNTKAQALDPNTTVSSANPPVKAIELNNQAVSDINNKKFGEAIPKLEEALKIHPAYNFARNNLGIARNNYAIELSNKKDFKGALKQLHHASFTSLAKDHKEHRENIDQVIEALGMDPANVKDREKLGDTALQEGDLISAIVEYREAYDMKPDSNLKAKLDQTIARLQVTDKFMSRHDSHNGVK